MGDEDYTYLRSYMKFPPWWGYGYFLELHNVALVISICPRIEFLLGVLVKL